MMDVRRTVWITAGTVLLAAAALGAAGWWTGEFSVLSHTDAEHTAVTEIDTAKCPAKQPVTPVSDVTGTRSAMVPIDADRVLLCAYAGLDPAPGVARFGLAAQVMVTDPAKVSKLRTALNDLTYQPGPGAHSCPMSTGASVLEIFSDGVHEVEVNQTVNGCQGASNGARGRRVGTSKAGEILLGLLPPAYCTSVWNQRDCASVTTP